MATLYLISQKTLELTVYLSTYIQVYMFLNFSLHINYHKIKLCLRDIVSFRETEIFTSVGLNAYRLAN
jgi:hypothetical protein